MPLFAAQSDIGPAFLFAYLAGSGLAILLGSLFQAILLMLAARLVRLPDVRYGRAWSAAAIGNVVCYGLLAVMAVGLAVGMAEDGTRSIRGSYMFLASPTNFIYLFVGATLVHTLLFSQRLADPDEPAIAFGWSAAVAVVYVGLCAGALAFLTVGLAAGRSALPK